MRKYLIRYLIFWLPAVLASYLFTSREQTFEIILWFLGFFMLLGWGVNTGMCAYNYPRNTLSLLLAYFGANALLITGLHNASFGSTAYRIFDHAAGFFTYRPLEMIYQTLLDFSVFQEMWVVGIVLGFCAVGFLSGLLYRQIRPNPYRPSFMADRK